MISEEKINKLVKEELESAKFKHGEYLNSEMEKFAVLREEIDEADEEMTAVYDISEYLWGIVKKNQNTSMHYNDIRQRALKGIQELIQVCAMCDKEIR